MRFLLTLQPQECHAKLLEHVLLGKSGFGASSLDGELLLLLIVCVGVIRARTLTWTLLIDLSFGVQTV